MVHTLTFKVLKVLFKNESHWGKILLEDEEGSKHEGVGVIPANPGLVPGDKVSLTGSFQVHPKYGPQFKFIRVNIEAEFKLIPMAKTLSDFKISGLGPKKCERIVEEFRESSFQLARDNPHALVVEGLTKELEALELSNKLKETSRDELMTYLWLNDIGERIGVGPSLKYKIFKKWGADAPTVIKSNPYSLCSLRGVGFKKADIIAKKLGIGELNEHRLESALIQTLKEEERNGHTLTPRKYLMSETLKLLGFKSSFDLSGTVATLALKRGLYWDEEGDWVSDFRLGIRLFKAYEKLVSRVNEETFASRLRISIVIEEIEKGHWQKHGQSLDDFQVEAVKCALINKVSIITGGPGTGKSTVSALVCEVLKHIGLSFALASPTGKASRVLSEKTRSHASTIHSLLGIGLKDPEKIKKKKEELSSYDYVIIDESSMVDSKLFCRIVESLPKETAIVFIGDPGQLPSVRPGQVLKDLMRSPYISVSKLKRVYRQNELSRIPELSSAIQSGIVPKKNWLNSHGIEHFDSPNVESILAELTGIYDSSLHLGKDLQVISPMKSGPLGVKNLNLLLREVHLAHAEKHLIVYEGNKKVIYLGERVIFSKNHKDIGLYNGDVATVKKVIFSQNESTEDTVVLQFSDRELCLPVSILKEADYAYAITIHKVQGAEFEEVVCPLSMGHFMMGSSELLTTAFSRAREKLYILGSYRTLASFIRGRSGVNKRRTMLSQIVIEKVDKELFEDQLESHQEVGQKDDLRRVQ